MDAISILRRVVAKLSIIVIEYTYQLMCVVEKLKDDILDTCRKTM